MFYKIIWGLVLFSILGYFIYRGYLDRIADFVEILVSQFSIFSIFMQDPLLLSLLSIIGIILALFVVLSFKK